MGGVGTTRGSADRVARYQGMEKCGARGGAGAGSAGRLKVVGAGMDEPLVELGDPVVFAVLKIRERECDRGRGHGHLQGRGGGRRGGGRGG